MRKTTLFVPLFALLTASITTGCGASAKDAMAPSMPAPAAMSVSAAPPADMSSEIASPSSTPAAPAPAMPSAPGHAPASSGAVATPAKPAAAGATQGAQKGKDVADAAAPIGIIYTGQIAMRTKREEFSKTIDKVVDVAESFGGAITARADDRVEVRVPSASFRKTMTALEDVGVVENRSVTAQDVSEEMHDLEVRLQNMRATRKRLEDFLAKATNITDTLTVERELERIALEIDRIEGRLSFLRAHTSFSQITVRFLEKPKDVAPVVATPPPPPPTPPRQLVDVPAPWLDKVGIDPLLHVHS